MWLPVERQRAAQRLIVIVGKALLKTMSNVWIPATSNVPGMQ